MNEAIRVPGMTEEECRQLIPPGTFLLGYAGSRAHGTYPPPEVPGSVDDIDLVGVAFAKPEVYLGLAQWDHVQIIRGQWDVTAYEVRKFVRLLLKQNPNVLSLLWLPDECYVHQTPAGQCLVNNRDLFTSTQIFHSFAGYAYEQLRHMEQRSVNSRMGEKRRKVVQRYGYDCLAASHLIRLLRMAIEFLGDGILRVRRPDASGLLEIKTGLRTLESVNAEATKLFKKAETAFAKSPLPATPQTRKAEELLMEIVRNYLLMGVA